SIDFTNDGKLLVTQASGDFASIAPDFNSFTFTLANAIDIATLGSTPYKLIDFGAPNDEFDFTATKAYFDPGTKSYRFGGFFGSAPDESGDGEIDALKLVFIDDETSEGGFTGTFTVIPEDEIPTPALLPGIIGMGIAAIRKRREDSAQADA
ncbi:MAG: PTPA-CTERM sorting domain-containing protein, partial [Elainellaceae cyanobacterium]